MNNIILITGIAFISLVFLVGLVMFFKSPDSIRNGGEYVLEYHRVANTSITEISPRIFFAFQFWPASGNRQIIPYMYASFRRFYFLIVATFWAELARCKDEKRYLTLIVLAFSGFFSTLFIFAGILMFAYGFLANLTFWMVWAVFVVIGGMAINLLPSFTLLSSSVPIIEKMNISEADKKYLIKLIKIWFIIALIATLWQIIKIILRSMEKNNE